jgi:hypothetical protein
MLTMNFGQLGRTVLMISLMALPLGAAACDSEMYEIDESSILAGESTDPSSEALGPTTQAAGDYVPAIPPCSSCVYVCNRYGHDSMECERCHAHCVGSHASAGDAKGDAAGDYVPAAPCCSICPGVCERFGSESLQCLRCEANCIDCNLNAGADCAN